MEPKQTRVRFSGANQEKRAESGSVIDRRTPQKTQSFKEKKKTQNWFQRQLFGQTSEDYDSNVEIEHATAVAAAAYAAKSIEESAISDNKREGNETGGSFVKIKSKKEEIPILKPEVPEPGRLPKIFSNLTKGTQEYSDSKESTNEKSPDKAILTAPSIKKPPTYEATLPSPSVNKIPTSSNKQFNGTSSIKPGTSAPKLDFPTTMKPTPLNETRRQSSTRPTTMKPTPLNETRRQSSTRPGVVKTKADEWEEAEMAKLEKRYEKQNDTILSWENKNKMKSKKKLERRESEIEQRRAKALKKFNKEMEYISTIAGGARAQSEEKRRNKVSKVKEKANALRKRGEDAPTTCCF